MKATEDSESGMLPTTDMLEAMGRYNDELRQAGILRDADGLKPSSHGKRIAFDGSSRTTRELVAGFWLWELKDTDEAVAWVKRCPNPMPGPSEIEIRPLYEMADLR
ncbi:MAG TPA: YciI family protein [Acetobacteraceae bacterium]|nr:YciI family protein [Acetobacteraceae bacterium]